MIWRIPAKTFLLGEYAAVAGAGAIILTTEPCFELTIGDDRHSHIHPESPAGRLWQQTGSEQSLRWHDPYAGQGGLGASSAQFVAAYLASGQTAEHTSLIDAYHQCAWSGHGLKPSGYDVLAQSQRQCVYINRQHQILQSYAWPFADLSFILIHSGHKLATHHHLQQTSLPDIPPLAAISEQARQAFEQASSAQLIQAVNAYQNELATQGLSAKHSLELIETLKTNPDVLSAKGCGALGADVLLLLIPAKEEHRLTHHFRQTGWTVLASGKDLYQGHEWIQKKSQ